MCTRVRVSACSCAHDMQCWALFNCLFQGFAFGDLLERHNVLQADGDQPWHAWRKVAEQPERACISGVLQTAKALRELRDLKTLLYSGLPVCLNLHPCRHQVLDTKLGQGAEVPKDEMGSEEYIRISHSLRSRVERFPRLPPSSRVCMFITAAARPTSKLRGGG